MLKGITVLLALLVVAAAAFYFSLYLPQQERLEETLREAGDQARDASVLRAKVAELEERLAEIEGPNESDPGAEGALSILEAVRQRLVAQAEQWGEGAEIGALDDPLRVTIAPEILFETGAADLLPKGLELVRALGVAVEPADRLQLSVEAGVDGGASEAGPDGRIPTGWMLATQRALAIARCLEDEVSLPPISLSAKGQPWELTTGADPSTKSNGEGPITLLLTVRPMASREAPSSQSEESELEEVGGESGGATPGLPDVASPEGGEG